MRYFAGGAGGGGIRGAEGVRHLVGEREGIRYLRGGRIRYFFRGGGREGTRYLEGEREIWYVGGWGGGRGTNSSECSSLPYTQATQGPKKLRFLKTSAATVVWGCTPGGEVPKKSTCCCMLLFRGVRAVVISDAYSKQVTFEIK